MHVTVLPVICGHSITRDLCSHRRPHAGFSRMNFRLRLGHTSSRRILLAAIPLIPAAVACLSSQVRDSLSPVCRECHVSTTLFFFKKKYPFYLIETAKEIKH